MVIVAGARSGREVCCQLHLPRQRDYGISSYNPVLTVDGLEVSAVAMGVNPVYTEFAPESIALNLFLP